MRYWSWLVLPLAWICVASVVGCGPYNSVATNHAGSAAIEPKYDTREADVDRDGDRAILSGHNQVNNPPWNLRAMPPAHAAGTELTHGRYVGNAYGDTIAKLALSVPGVTSSAAVTSGRVVIIGIGLRHATPHDVAAIQREIRRRLIGQAPEFRYVYVTVDRSQVVELNRIADGLRSGQPLSTYQGRMRNLMHNMAPIPLY